MVKLEQGPQQHHVLTVTSLHYKESVIEYVHVGIDVGGGGGGGGGRVGVSVVIVVIGRLWYKRKKRLQKEHAGGPREDVSVANSVCLRFVEPLLTISVI